ncbi:hypothetical protein PCE1_000405 [Barthelona sp. PCE]
MMGCFGYEYFDIDGIHPESAFSASHWGSISPSPSFKHAVEEVKPSLQDTFILQAKNNREEIIDVLDRFSNGILRLDESINLLHIYTSLSKDEIAQLLLPKEEIEIEESEKELTATSPSEVMVEQRTAVIPTADYNSTCSTDTDVLLGEYTEQYEYPPVRAVPKSASPVKKELSVSVSPKPKKFVSQLKNRRKRIGYKNVLSCRDKALSCRDKALSLDWLEVIDEEDELSENDDPTYCPDFFFEQPVENIFGKKTSTKKRRGMRRKPQLWTQQDDDRLREAVKVFKGKNWKQVARRVGNKTADQCSQRWHRCLHPAIKKGPWTKEEDEQLIRIYYEVGRKNNWKAISSRIPHRVDTQISHRIQYLHKIGRLQ